MGTRDQSDNEATDEGAGSPEEGAESPEEGAQARDAAEDAVVGEEEA